MRVLLAAALLVTGCARTEEIPIDPAFEREVRALLGDAEIAMTGRTCDRVTVDGHDADSHRHEAEGTLSGDPDALFAAVRAAAVERGWQPVTADGAAFALHGPGNTNLGADPRDGGLRVRVSAEKGCSSWSGFAFARLGDPVLTESQRDRMSSALAAITDTLDAVYGTPRSWPALDDAALVCGDDRVAGANLQLGSGDAAPAGADHATAVARVDAALAGWEVSKKEQKFTGDGAAATYVATTVRDGVALEVDVRVSKPDGKPAMIRAGGDSGCVPAR